MHSAAGNSEFPLCSTSSAARFRHSAALTWRTKALRLTLRTKVKAEHNTEKKEGSEKKGYLVEECSYGTYERSFRFDDADPSDISAAFANGELDVCLKKAPKKQPNAIKIN